MKTSIELNEELVKEALRLTKFQTEKELIDFALQELIRTRQKRNLLDLSGQIQFSTDYDYKALRENMVCAFEMPKKPGLRAWVQKPGFYQNL